jgi:phytoene dehydrogenase-like protein
MKPSSNTFDAVIVGAGHNGLIAAFYLARAGQQVLVLESKPFVGGCCAAHAIPSEISSPAS